MPLTLPLPFRAPSRRGRRRRRRSPLVSAIASVLVLVLSAAVVTASGSAPAAAAGVAGLSVAKVVNASTPLSPGEEFSYTVDVTCADSACFDVVLTDALPDEFVGFTLVGAPLVTTSTVATSVSVDGCAVSGGMTSITAPCTIDVTVTQSIDEGVGIPAGDGFTLTYTLKVPQDLTPAWAWSGLPISNTATVIASNAPSASDSADVSVTIPVVVDVAVGKSWMPAAQQFQPGVASTLTLSVGNTSNSPAESLALQDPRVAVGGATSLPASNPFRLVDVTGFGGMTLPQGADRVQVDAYVLDGAEWVWRSGTPSTTPALPAGVSTADVAGLRFSFTAAGGAVLAAGGSAGSVELLVSQRSADRQSGDSLVLGATASNIVTGTVVVTGQPDASKDAAAPYEIGGLTVRVQADKVISPATIPAGGAAEGRVSARNASNGPLTSLVVSDTDFFSTNVGFGGFSAAPVWPAGATAATVTWHVGGTAQTPVALVPDVIPAPPAGVVTGFELTFAGTIGVGATGGVDFTIDTTPALVPTVGDSPKSLSNSVTARGANAAGTHSATRSAPLTVYFPEVSLSIDKTVSPAEAVPVGGTVVVQLSGVTSAESRYVRPDRIVFEDVASGAVDDFWEAFIPTGVAPTQVPLGSTLDVDYRDGAGDWHPLGSWDATVSAIVVEVPIDPSVAPIVTGLRYAFTSVGQPFAQATSVAPNTIFTARSTKRTSGDPVAPGTSAEAVYENIATAQATGVADTVTVTSPLVEDAATAAVVQNPGDGVLYVDKRWLSTSYADKATVTSQSGERVLTRLAWGAPVAGFASVTITDPAGGAAAPASTTFQAFDLTRIRPVAFASESLLRWDAVSTVELFHSGSWHTVSAPGGSWMGTSGFTGYTLTAEESTATTGVRITVVPDDTARSASDDPRRPAPGSGIATGAAGAHRFFDLEWRLRNVVRDTEDVKWATALTPFNVAGSPGTVRNTVAVEATRFDSGTASGADSDTISLVDFAPNVNVEVTTDKSTLVIPNPGDVDPAAYPSLEITIVGESTAVPRASYVRVTAATECGPAMPGCRSAAVEHAGDPFDGAVYTSASPFERLTLTGLTFTAPAEQVSRDHSIVTLWLRGADGSLSTTTQTIAQAEALPASALGDVVGVSVLYQGADPARDGGSIINGADLRMALATQLRETLRSGSASAYLEPVTLEGFGYAQSYDPVLRPTGPDSSPIAADSALVALVDGELDVTAAKDITVATVLERDRATATLQVALSATDGASTAPTHRVTVTDDDARFWDAATLTGLGAVTLPAGADRVRADVLVDGGWVLGSAGAVATLPAVDLGEVTGIRFVFDRADGGLFSATSIPADWSTTVVFTAKLRDIQRGGGSIVFPSSVPNAVDVESRRTDPIEIFTPATATASDIIALATGTFGLDVAKDPQGGIHTHRAGDAVEWTLALRNTGTGYLTLEELVDSLPPHLTFAGEEPAYAGSAGGTLSTTPTLTSDAATGALRFTWPDGGDRMSPGETFSITLATTVEFGAPASTTNAFVVRTLQPLATCTNDSGNGQGVLPGLAADECGTSNYVQLIQGANISATKGVRADIGGTPGGAAVNTSNPARACVADAAGYFRNPCAATTVIGGVDQWRLTTLNSGTEAVTALTIIDPLPTAGDRMLDQGGPRASTWRPVFDPSFGVDFAEMPSGATATWQVSTDAAVCVGTEATSAWGADSTCSANTWVDAAVFAGDWRDVTGLRVVYDFSGTANGVLEPGEGVALLFRTINEPATAADPSLAPITVPVTGQYAWNQMGATATFASSAPMRRAPAKVGLTLASGPLEVIKLEDGPAASFAPNSYGVDLACEVAGTSLDLGPAATLTLDTSNALRTRVDGLPLGAECTVEEHGVTGAYGETSRSVDVPTVVIDTDAGVARAVPAGQSTTITNTYEWGALTIAKRAEKLLASVGEEIAYTVTVTNTGARPAVGQTVTDTLPSGARLVSSAPAASVSGGELTWATASLAPGESASFRVVVTFATAGSYVNRADVTTPSGSWKPIESDDPCADDATAACAAILVTALAMTGTAELDVALAVAFGLIVAGMALLIIRAFRRRSSAGAR